MNALTVVSRRVALEKIDLDFFSQKSFNANGQAKLDILGVEFLGYTRVDSKIASFNAKYLKFDITIVAELDKRIRISINQHDYDRHGMTYTPSTKLDYKYDINHFINEFRKIKTRLDEFDTILTANELTIAGLKFVFKNDGMSNEFTYETKTISIGLKFDFQEVDILISIDRYNSFWVELPLTGSMIKPVANQLKKLNATGEKDRMKNLVNLDEALPEFQEQYFRKSSLLSKAEVQNFRKELLDIVKKYKFKAK